MTNTSEGQNDKKNLMFMYWGRRGALTRFSLDLAAVAHDRATARFTMSVSRDNSSFDKFRYLGDKLFPVSTFETYAGALLNAWSLPVLRANVRRRLRADQTAAVIDLLPHVWSPLVAPAIKSTGALYVPIIHDADPHPGDWTSLAKRWLDRSIAHADLVLTLSGAVAGRLEALGKVPRSKIVTLFHPDLGYARRTARRAPASGTPFRLLFLGRIMNYKGLPLFIDAAEILRAAGLPIEVGVFGEGPLGSYHSRLQGLGAEVVNRWLSDEEISATLGRYDVVVLSHIEASQSGVAAAAMGAGIPVVATPVGGLVEQVIDGRTGILALRADSLSLAEAIEDLVCNPVLYNSICDYIQATREERSISRFVDRCVAEVFAISKSADLR